MPPSRNPPYIPIHVNWPFRADEFDTVDDLDKLDHPSRLKWIQDLQISQLPKTTESKHLNRDKVKEEFHKGGNTDMEAQRKYAIPGKLEPMEQKPKADAEPNEYEGSNAHERTKRGNMFSRPSHKNSKHAEQGYKKPETFFGGVRVGRLSTNTDSLFVPVDRVIENRRNAKIQGPSLKKRGLDDEVDGEVYANDGFAFADMKELIVDIKGIKGRYFNGAKDRVSKSIGPVNVSGTNADNVDYNILGNPTNETQHISYMTPSGNNKDNVQLVRRELPQSSRILPRGSRLMNSLMEQMNEQTNINGVTVKGRPQGTYSNFQPNVNTQSKMTIRVGRSGQEADKDGNTEVGKIDNLGGNVNLQNEVKISGTAAEVEHKKEIIEGLKEDTMTVETGYKSPEGLFRPAASASKLPSDISRITPATSVRKPVPVRRPAASGKPRPKHKQPELDVLEAFKHFKFPPGNMPKPNRLNSDQGRDPQPVAEENSKEPELKEAEPLFDNQPDAEPGRNYDSDDESDEEYDYTSEGWSDDEREYLASIEKALLSPTIKSDYIAPVAEGAVLGSNHDEDPVSFDQDEDPTIVEEEEAATDQKDEEPHHVQEVRLLKKDGTIRIFHLVKPNPVNRVEKRKVEVGLEEDSNQNPKEGNSEGNRAANEVRNDIDETDSQKKPAEEGVGSDNEENVPTGEDRVFDTFRDDELDRYIRKYLENDPNNYIGVKYKKSDGFYPLNGFQWVPLNWKGHPGQYMVPRYYPEAFISVQKDGDAGQLSQPTAFQKGPFPVETIKPAALAWKEGHSVKGPNGRKFQFMEDDYNPETDEFIEINGELYFVRNFGDGTKKIIGLKRTTGVHVYSSHYDSDGEYAESDYEGVFDDPPARRSGYDMIKGFDPKTDYLFGVADRFYAFRISEDGYFSFARCIVSEENKTISIDEREHEEFDITDPKSPAMKRYLDEINHRVYGLCPYTDTILDFDGTLVVFRFKNKEDFGIVDITTPNKYGWVYVGDEDTPELETDWGDRVPTEEEIKRQKEDLEWLRKTLSIGRKGDNPTLLDGFKWVEKRDMAGEATEEAMKGSVAFGRIKINPENDDDWESLDQFASSKVPALESKVYSSTTKSNHISHNDVVTDKVEGENSRPVIQSLKSPFWSKHIKPHKLANHLDDEDYIGKGKRKASPEQTLDKRSVIFDDSQLYEDPADSDYAVNEPHSHLQSPEVMVIEADLEPVLFPTGSMPELRWMPRQMPAISGFQWNFEVQSFKVPRLDCFELAVISMVVLGICMLFAKLTACRAQVVSGVVAIEEGLGEELKEKL